MDKERKTQSKIHDVVDRCFRPIQDKPCWNVHQGHGSFLSFEFGKPSLVVQEPRPTSDAKVSKKVRQLRERRIVNLRGEWHLWIYCCDWSLELANDRSVHSESTRGAISKALLSLNGQMLKRVRVSPRTGASVFEFDLGAKLRTTAYDDDDSDDEPYENWMFFDRDGYVLLFRADGKYSYHRSDKSTRNWMK